MDDYLLEYLRSGKAWLLVGSGHHPPLGIHHGNKLALVALQLCKVQAIGNNLNSLELASTKANSEGLR